MRSDVLFAKLSPLPCILLSVASEARFEGDEEGFRVSEGVVKLLLGSVLSALSDSCESVDKLGEIGDCSLLRGGTGRGEPWEGELPLDLLGGGGGMYPRSSRFKLIPIPWLKRFAGSGGGGPCGEGRLNSSWMS